MKRLILVVFCAFLLIIPVFSQARLGDFTMRGAASQVMKTEGFVGAHPSLPLNSKVKITNPANGKEIEITIVSRIEPSMSRIIDLSYVSTQALGIRSGDTVILSVSAPAPLPPKREDIVELTAPIVRIAEEPKVVLPPPVVSAPPSITETPQIENEPEIPINIITENIAPAPAVEPAPLVPSAPPSVTETPQIENKPEIPAKITPALAEEIAAYIPNEKIDSMTEQQLLDMASTAAGNEASREFLAWLMTMSIEARESREAREAREIREAREVREAREARETKVQPSSGLQSTLNRLSLEPQDIDLRVSGGTARPFTVSPEDLEIIPGLPDRNSGRVYKLQFGAFSAPDAASKVAAAVSAAGFTVSQEAYGQVYRVFAVDIAADDVYPAAVRLGALGFKQIWVRE